jgi:hypothetical protein
MCGFTAEDAPQVVLQTSAQNVGWFVAARILIGYGTSASALTGPAYLAGKWPGTSLGSC